MRGFGTSFWRPRGSIWDRFCVHSGGLGECFGDPGPPRGCPRSRGGKRSRQIVITIVFSDLAHECLSGLAAWIPISKKLVLLFREWVQIIDPACPSCDSLSRSTIGFMCEALGVLFGTLRLHLEVLLESFRGRFRRHSASLRECFGGPPRAPPRSQGGKGSRRSGAWVLRGSSPGSFSEAKI